MKKLLLITGIFFLLLQCIAAQDDDPIKNLDLVQMNKVAGTWESKTANATLTLVLQVKELNQGPGADIYFLTGWYCYIKDGKVLVNELDSAGKNRYAGFTGYIKKGDPAVHFSFTDDITDQLKRGAFTFQNEAQTIAAMKFGEINSHKTTFNKPKKEKNKDAASIPEMILKKIK